MTEKYKNEILNERLKTHGDFNKVSLLAQALKEKIRDAGEFSIIKSSQQEALDLICTKLARIAHGNPNEPDHWKDIAGYANLISEEMEKNP